MIILVTTSASRPKTIGGILGLNRFHVLWKAFGTVPAFIENSMQTVRHRLTSATLYFVRLFITNVIHFDVRFARLFVIRSRSVRDEIILSWHEQVRQFRYRQFVTVKGRVRLVCDSSLPRRRSGIGLRNGHVRLHVGRCEVRPALGCQSLRCWMN